MFRKLLTLENILLIAILLLAIFLRFYKIDQYLTFLGDEGRDVLVVWNILHGDPTLLGPTASVGGFFLGPIYYYFMAPFLWLFNYNPVGPAVMVALAGVITVWMVYKVGKYFFNTVAGLIAAFFYAISPLVITYSRSSWNPNLMPLFTLLTLLILYKAVRKSDLRLYLLTGFLLGICLQLHYIEVFLGAIIGLYMLLTTIFNGTKKSVSIKAFQLIKQYVCILGGFLLGWSPFLAFEVRHGFPNIQSIFKFIFHSEEVTSKGDVLSIINSIFFRVFGRLVTAYPIPETVSTRANGEYAIWYYCTLVLALCVTFFLAQRLYSSYTSKNTQKFQQYLLLAMWLILGVFFFGFYKKQIYDYYFEFMFPLPFILVGAFFSFLWMKNLLGKGIVVVLIIILTVLNYLSNPLLKPPNNQLAQVRGVAEFVIQKTNNKPYNLALISGGNSDYAYRYWFEVWNKPPVTLQHGSGAFADPSSVTDQLLVICEQNPCHPLGNSLWEIAGFGRAEIVGEWDVSVLKVYKLQHYKEN